MKEDLREGMTLDLIFTITMIVENSHGHKSSQAAPIGSVFTNISIARVMSATTKIKKWIG